MNRPQTSSNTSSDTSSHLQYGITDTRPALDQRCSRLVRQLISILLVVDWYIQPVNRPSNHLRVQPVWHLHSGRNREWGAEIKLLYHLGWQPISIMLACVWIGLVIIFSGSNAEYTCQHFHLNLFAYLTWRSVEEGFSHNIVWCKFVPCPYGSFNTTETVPLFWSQLNSYAPTQFCDKNPVQ